MAVVERSELITCLEEARNYYRARLVGVRRVTCCGQRVEIVFPFDAVHVYSEKAPDPPPGDAVLVTQPVGPARFEVRVFSLKRARLMDCVLPAISLFTVSIVGQRKNKVLYGRQLPSGEYMCVALRPGPNTAWTCVSAFPVSHDAWLQALRSKRAKFPP